MDDLDALPPTMRKKQRYIVFEIVSNQKFNIGDVVNTLWITLGQLYGEFGTSKLFIWIPSNLYDEEKKVGIIRCDRDGVEQVRAALASIRMIESEPLIMRTLGVTGTIKSAKMKFLHKMDMDLTAFAKSKEGAEDEEPGEADEEN